MAKMKIDNRTRQLAREALRKLQASKKPNRDEQAALHRIETAREEELRSKYYATIPKRHYLALSGRQARTVNDQAVRYGMPIPVGRGHSTIDLGELLHWLHDFLADNAQRLAMVEGDDPMSGSVTPMIELWREEKWRLTKLDRLERENTLLPRETVRELHVRLAGLLRRYGETIQRDRSLDPVELFGECLDDFQRLVDGHQGESAFDQAAAKEPAPGETPSAPEPAAAAA